MKSYLEVVSLIQRVRYDYLCLVGKKLYLVGADDLNPVGAMILLHIADARIAANEVKTIGNYLGSNLNEVLKKLLETGYLLRERSSNDLRTFDILLTEKGRSLRDRLIDMHMGLRADRAGDRSLKRTVSTLHQIEQFWIDRRLSDG